MRKFYIGRDNRRKDNDMGTPLFGIHVKDKYESEKVQGILFSYNIRWYEGKEEVKFPHGKELHVWSDNTITFSTSIWGAHNETPMYTAKEFLETPKKIIFKHSIGMIPVPTYLKSIYWEVTCNANE